jgi:hypothetical protein
MGPEPRQDADNIVDDGTNDSDERARPNRRPEGRAPILVVKIFPVSLDFE